MKYNQEGHWFSGAYFALYFAFACLSTYMIPFLKEIGYDAIQRGLVFSAMALTSILLQFLTGYLCDKFHIIKKSFLMLNILEVIATFACFTYTKQVFWMHLFLISAMGGLYKLNYNLLDSWSLLCSPHTAKKFGIMRALGAIGFSLGSFTTAFAIKEASSLGQANASSYDLIPWLVFASTIIGLLCCMKLPEARKSKGWSSIRKEDFQALWQTRSYVVLIVIFLCINIVGTADQYTTIDKLMHLDATSIQISYKWAIQSLSEIPVFLLSLWLLRKVGGYQIMVIGTVFYIIKFFFYGVSPNVGAILLTTTLQTITYPLITISSRTLFANIAKHHSNLKTSTQLIASSITLGGSALITPILCGIMVSTFGHDTTLYVLAALLIPVLIYALKHRNTILESSLEKKL